MHSPTSPRATSPRGASRLVTSRRLTSRRVIGAGAAAGALTLAFGGGVAVSDAFGPLPKEVVYNIPSLPNGSVNPDPFLANGVAIGKGVALYTSSGTGPGGLNTAAGAGTPERYVDPAQFPGGLLPAGVSLTEAQGMNTMARIAENLATQGLGVHDIVFMRIYLDNPPGAAGADYAGWNRAYRKYMANVNRATGAVIPAYEPVVVANETRPARSNIEVATLPVAGWLIEIEVIAAFPTDGADGKE